MKIAPEPLTSEISTSEEKVCVVCKCIPGFEQVVVIECSEVLGVGASSSCRGRVHFDIHISQTIRVQQLRSVSHYWVQVYNDDNYFTNRSNDTEEEVLKSLEELASTLNWELPLQTWKLFKIDYNTRYLTTTNNDDVDDDDDGDAEVEVKKKKLSEAEEENACEESNGNNSSTADADSISTPVQRSFKSYHDIDPLVAGVGLSFRVTAQRSGSKHKFTSMQAAHYFGGAVNDHFNWKVDMKNFDIEVVLHLMEGSLSVGIQLTLDNQSHRNIRHFGPTTLKANIAYSLLRFANIQTGDMVCDPMCGSGAISVEGALGLPKTFQLAGENHPIAIQHSAENIQALEEEKGDSYTLPASVIQWDIYQLPLRTSCVDKIVTDLPFGKKIGNKERNMFLYPVALNEMGRVCRPSGRAVLLTGHKGAIARAVKNSELWKNIEVKKICMGGLNVVVYSLQRTNVPHRPLNNNDKGNNDKNIKSKHNNGNNKSDNNGNDNGSNNKSTENQTDTNGLPDTHTDSQRVDIQQNAPPVEGAV